MCPGDTESRETTVTTAGAPSQCIVPHHILDRLARTGSDELRNAALDTIAIDQRFRLARAESSIVTHLTAQPVSFGRTGGSPKRAVYDEHHSQDQTPGTLERGEGQPTVSDTAVNNAYDGFGYTYDFYWTVLERDSIDGAGMTLEGMVHFGRNYDNAFYDGNGHMFFGDGDGQALTDTTAGIDVIGHELTHGVTQVEANLTYSGQSGALNESMSDVMGIQVKQWARKQDVTTSDWLIGADIVGPQLSPALRSMKAPGTANAHDDQPADMDGYVSGGDVHTNSGIPNHAFYLVASSLGGHAWDAAGPIWYAALRDAALKPNATFKEFATITLKQARQTYGSTSTEAQAVEQGWTSVKVL
jgi:Zn-dependent metalloprotease